MNHVFFNNFVWHQIPFLPSLVINNQHISINIRNRITVTTIWRYDPLCQRGGDSDVDSAISYKQSYWKYTQKSLRSQIQSPKAVFEELMKKQQNRNIGGKTSYKAELYIMETGLICRYSWWDGLSWILYLVWSFKRGGSWVSLKSKASLF